MENVKVVINHFMKIEYYLTPHRVIHCRVHLREMMNVETVLNECVWLPPVLKVHIETRKCCREPQFLLDGTSALTDSRLARYVALEGSVFQTTCHACGSVKTVESTDMSLLHWRSQAEVRYWKSMPWFSVIMEHSRCTLLNGEEALWSALPTNTTLVNQAPAVLQPFNPEVLQVFQRLFESVVPQIRRCVHSRLYPYMQYLFREGKVYVAFRQKREDGFYFMVKQRPRCMSWPRQFLSVEDVFPVVSAFRCAQGVMSLEQFMMAVVQLVHVADDEYLLVVNWDNQLLDGHEWCYESKTKDVHGMSVKYPCIKLALGTTRPWTFFHGTTMQAALSILDNGFESNAFHECSGTYYKCNPPFACSCKGMLGPGVYCASFEKAAANAGRVSGPFQKGMVLECQVMPGECKFVTTYSSELCQCGCSSLYSDHVASWYHEQLYDSIFLCSKAGVKREELCVRRPNRIVPINQWVVKFNDKRERIFVEQGK